MSKQNIKKIEGKLIGCMMITDFENTWMEGTQVETKEWYDIYELAHEIIIKGDNFITSDENVNYVLISESGKKIYYPFEPNFYYPSEEEEEVKVFEF